MTRRPATGGADQTWNLRRSYANVFSLVSTSSGLVGPIRLVPYA